jgi:hypothetical protein
MQQEFPFYETVEYGYGLREGENRNSNWSKVMPWFSFTSYYYLKQK